RIEHQIHQLATMRRNEMEPVSGIVLRLRGEVRLKGSAKQSYVEAIFTYHFSLSLALTYLKRVPVFSCHQFTFLRDVGVKHHPRLNSKEITCQTPEPWASEVQPGKSLSLCGFGRGVQTARVARREN